MRKNVQVTQVVACILKTTLSGLSIISLSDLDLNLCKFKLTTLGWAKTQMCCQYQDLTGRFRKLHWFVNLTLPNTRHLSLTV